MGSTQPASTSHTPTNQVNKNNVSKATKVSQLGRVGPLGHNTGCDGARAR